MIDTDYTENRGREQKEVAFAYASSPDAERLGYAATGCWTVSTGKGYTLRARKAFATWAEAQAHALTLDVPFSRYTVSK